MGYMEDIAMSAGPTGNEILDALMGATKPFDYRMDPNAVGKMSEFERAQYYEYLKKAQEAGLNVGTQQQSLADALLARSEGRAGPSLAELQLQQTLAQQKGDIAGSIAAAGRQMNPALARRLLIEQQAKAQQVASGQGALLRAKEQQDAQAALAAQLGAMRTAEQNAMQTAGSLGLQQEKLGVETQEEQKKREFEKALADQRAGVEMRKADAENARNSRKDLGSFLTEAGKVASLFSRGGMVQNYAEGGKVKKPMPKAKLIAAHAAAKKNVKAFTKEYGKEEGKNIAYATMTKLAKENKLADGGNVGAAMGKLAKMDNEKNDTIPAMLSPGEIVIPRSVVNAPNAPVAAAKFVEALLANKDKKDAKKLALMAALGKK